MIPKLKIVSDESDIVERMMADPEVAAILDKAVKDVRDDLTKTMLYGFNGLDETLNEVFKGGCDPRQAGISKSELNTTVDALCVSKSTVAPGEVIKAGTPVCATAWIEEYQEDIEVGIFRIQRVPKRGRWAAFKRWNRPKPEYLRRYKPTQIITVTRQKTVYGVKPHDNGSMRCRDKVSATLIDVYDLKVIK